MKTPRIANAVGNIDDDLIIKSENSSISKKKSPWIKWTTLAACLMIFAVVGALFIPMLRGAKSEDEVDREDMNGIYGETPNGEAKSILNAWSGELTKEKLKWAIEEYGKNYTNIVLEEDTDFTVSFEVDFPAASCSVIRVSSVDDNDTDCEWEEGVLNFYLDAELDNKTVTVSILDFDSTMEKYPVVSYVVAVKDIKGKEIHYYFRVDYSNLKNTSNQEKKSYKVEISKPADVRIENEVKASYAEGEVVTVKLKRINGYYDFTVNGVNQSYEESTADHLIYSFVMPGEDVRVKIEPWYLIDSVSPGEENKTVE